jgi:hypothetical protein
VEWNLGRVLEKASRIKSLHEKERLLNLDAAVALFVLTKQMYRASEGSASEDQKMEEVKEV